MMSGDLEGSFAMIQNVNDVELAPVSMDGAVGVRGRVLVGRAEGVPNFAARLFEVDAGGHSPRHRHDYEHEVVILRGEGTVFLDGEERAIREGDVVYVRANEEHQFKTVEGLRFLCFAPVHQGCGAATPGT